MKTQITEQMKAQYMALYWGQRILKCPKYGAGTYYTVGAGFLQSYINDSHLSLRSINDLTEEEYQHVASLLGYSISTEEDTAYLGEQFCENGELEDVVKDHPNLSGFLLNIADYLRSIGIALPYLGVPVDDWISAGVVIIKTKEVQ